MDANKHGVRQNWTLTPTPIIMFFYISISLISTILVYLAQRTSPKILSKFFLICSILIPSVIGGCRDTSIGTDLQGYGILFFDEIRQYNSITKLFSEWNYSSEYGYVLLNYISSKISKDIHAFLFLSELIKMSLVVWTAWNYRKLISSHIVVFTYMIFMYWYGLSLLRQSLAMCICLSAMIYFSNRKYAHFLLIVTVAYLFHNSAIFFCILPILDFIYKKIKQPQFFMLTLIAVIYFCSSSIFYIIASSGLFRIGILELYENSGVTLSKSNLLLSFFIFLSTLSIRGKRLKCNKYYKFLVLTNAALSILFLLLSQFFEIAFRISFYQMMFLIIYYPFLLKNMSNIPLKISYMTIYISIYLLHYYVNVDHGLADTIPYTSRILNL